MRYISGKRLSLVLMMLASVLANLSLTGCGGRDDPTGTGGDGSDAGLSFIAPYVNQAEMAPINEAFSATAGAPWGFVHNGIDFGALGATADFQAVCAGTIAAITIETNNVTGNAQIRVSLAYNSGVQIDYNFETMSDSNVERDAQRAAIGVSVGQTVVWTSPGSLDAS